MGNGEGTTMLVSDDRQRDKPEVVVIQDSKRRKKLPAIYGETEEKSTSKRTSVKDRLGTDSGLRPVPKLSLAKRLGETPAERPAAAGSADDDEADRVEDDVELLDSTLPVIRLGGNSGLTLELDDALYITVEPEGKYFVGKLSLWDVASALEKIGKGAVPRLSLRLASENEETSSTTYKVVSDKGLLNVQRIQDHVDGKSFKVSGSNTLFSIKCERSAKVGDEKPWESYYKHKFDICLPGERADTIVLYPVPSRWVKKEHVKEIFGVFGVVEQSAFIGVDPEGKESSSFCVHSKIYVQFRTCRGFKSAMDCFKSRVLCWQRSSDCDLKRASIVCQFDKTAYLSEGAIRQRRWVMEQEATRAAKAVEDAKRAEEERIKAAERAKAEAARLEKEAEEKAARIQREYEEAQRAKEERRRVKREQKEARRIEREKEEAERRRVEEEERKAEEEAKEKKRLERIAKAEAEIERQRREEEDAARKRAQEAEAEEKLRQADLLVDLSVDDDDDLNEEDLAASRKSNPAVSKRELDYSGDDAWKARAAMSRNRNRPLDRPSRRSRISRSDVRSRLSESNLPSLKSEQASLSSPEDKKSSTSDVTKELNLRSRLAARLGNKSISNNTVSTPSSKSNGNLQSRLGPNPNRSDGNNSKREDEMRAKLALKMANRIKRTDAHKQLKEIEAKELELLSRIKVLEARKATVSNEAVQCAE